MSGPARKHDKHCHYFLVQKNKFCGKELNRQSGLYEYNHFCEKHQKLNGLCFIVECEWKYTSKQKRLVASLVRKYERKQGLAETGDGKVYEALVTQLQTCTACGGAPSVNVKPEPGPQDELMPLTGPARSPPALLPPLIPRRSSEASQDSKKNSELKKLQLQNKILREENETLQKRVIKADAETDTLTEISNTLDMQRQVEEIHRQAAEEKRQAAEEQLQAVKDQTQARVEDLIRQVRDLDLTNQQLIQEGKQIISEQSRRAAEAERREAETKRKAALLISEQTRRAEEAERLTEEQKQEIERQNWELALKSGFRMYFGKFIKWMFSTDLGAEEFRRKYSADIENDYNKILGFVRYVWDSPDDSLEMYDDDDQKERSGESVMSFWKTRRTKYISRRSGEKTPKNFERFLGNFVWWLLTQEKSQYKKMIQEIRTQLQISITTDMLRNFAYTKWSLLEQEYEEHTKESKVSEELSVKAETEILETAWQKKGNYLTPTMKAKFEAQADPSAAVDSSLSKRRIFRTENPIPPKKIRINDEIVVNTSNSPGPWFKSRLSTNQKKQKKTKQKNVVNNQSDKTQTSFNI